MSLRARTGEPALHRCTLILSRAGYFHSASAPRTLFRLDLLVLAVLFLLSLPQSISNAQSWPPSNHVLDLDGTNSCVQLPRHLFTNQSVIIEGWVKWRGYGQYSRFFQFADAALQLAVLNKQNTATLSFERFSRPPFDGLRTVVPDVIHLDQWQHMSAEELVAQVRSLVPAQE